LISPAAPPPLAVYVHWPYCARICPYCDFNVVRERGRTDEQAALAGAIVGDLKAQAARLGPRRLVSIFFGGGTPSLMDPRAVATVIDAATALWPAGGPVEISLEANPTDGEGARFANLASAGVARLSLGLQSLQDEALAFLGRNHSAREGADALRHATALFPRVSADLIYALPGQTAAAWAGELGRLNDFGVEHISPYQLTIEAGTAFDRAVRRGGFQPADPDLAADLYDLTQATLEGFGFEAYEVSNHARGPAARSRHNLAYWRGEDYVGVGPGAHGRLSLPAGRTATVAARKVADYILAVRHAGVGWAETEVYDPIACAEERLLMGLRTAEGVPFAQLTAIGLGPRHPQVRDYVEAGLLVDDSRRLIATPHGRLLLDRLTTELSLARTSMMGREALPA
jgi:putative oxygen-independent coproporphyrinogen III oxidase